ncbi:unnamed protein product [Pleuronectes platessa]|uniref:Uncharacterized protein n=1 Tax=Pleuronectes platessa TaxID=8262 RepID=A0A9N7Y5C8_PLEPL|nr:unnamed protein product [Pleuronectes platessa]
MSQIGSLKLSSLGGGASVPEPEAGGRSPVVAPAAVEAEQRGGTHLSSSSKKSCNVCRFGRAPEAEQLSSTCGKTSCRPPRSRVMDPLQVEQFILKSFSFTRIQVEVVTASLLLQVSDKENSSTERETSGPIRGEDSSVATRGSVNSLFPQIRNGNQFLHSQVPTTPPHPRPTTGKHEERRRKMERLTSSGPPPPLVAGCCRDTGSHSLGFDCWSEDRLLNPSFRVEDICRRTRRVCAQGAGHRPQRPLNRKQSWEGPRLRGRSSSSRPRHERREGGEGGGGRVNNPSQKQHLCAAGVTALCRAASSLGCSQTPSANSHQPIGPHRPPSAPIGPGPVSPVYMVIKWEQLVTKLHCNTSLTGLQGAGKECSHRPTSAAAAAGRD